MCIAIRTDVAQGQIGLELKSCIISSQLYKINMSRVSFDNSYVMKEMNQ